MKNIFIKRFEVAMATGIAVTGTAARPTSSTWTLTPCAQSRGELHPGHMMKLNSMTLTVLCRCTINTAQGYRVLNTQNSDKSNIKVQQAGREFNFEICGDGGYRSRMAQSYDNMVGPVM